MKGGKYEKESDYTCKKTEQELDKIWGNIKDADINNLEFCKANNIKYFDTSVNRDKVFKDILKFCMANK